MTAFIKKKRQWWITWLVVWIVMYLLAILMYPGNPSIWFGWLPSSVVTTFGLMVISLILGYLFSKQRFSQK